MILHHIQSSPMQSTALKTCLRYIGDTDTLLLSGNAVNCLLNKQWQLQLSTHKVILLKDDVIARGLQTKLASFEFIDYDDFVAETLSHSKVINW